MLTFIFILLVIFSLFISYYFTSKISNQRKQILLLKYQNNNLKRKIDSNKHSNIEIQYLKPEFSEGTINKDCELFISPFADSTIINSLSTSFTIEIQDSAIVTNELWYEISLPTVERLNSKGWVKGENVHLKKYV